MTDDERLQGIKARCAWGQLPQTFNQSEDDHKFYREVEWLVGQLDASQQRAVALQAENARLRENNELMRITAELGGSAMLDIFSTKGGDK